MSIQIKIQADDLKQLKANFEDLPRTILPFLRRASEKAAFEIEGESKRRAPVDTGRLRASISTSLGIVKNIGAIVQTNVNYAAFVHEGTRPHFPPISALEKWSKRKGLNAGAVARSIARKGTKAQPFMREAVENKEKEIAKHYETEITKGLQLLKDGL